MTNWKQGDTVTFTLTGTIAHINDGLATIEVRGIPLKVHVSHILGTPEQAKRERIIAIIEREFQEYGVKCEPMVNDASGFMLIFKEEFPATYQREQAIHAIQTRITELEQL